MSYTPPKRLEDMGARYEHVHRPESPVELRHSIEYLMSNYCDVALAFPMSGDNLTLMQVGDRDGRNQNQQRTTHENQTENPPDPPRLLGYLRV